MPLMRSRSMHRLGCLLLGVLWAACGPGALADRAPLVRNLIADYGPVQKDRDIAGILQKAINDVGAAGGGTIVIPARADPWMLLRPVFVGYPNVTLAGEGAGTRVFGGATFFLFGVKQQYAQLSPEEAFPLISEKGGALDASVKGARYGLRSTDGKTPLSGYFPACPLAFGYKVPRDPSGDYWKDYAAGTGKPTYWRHWPQYTINLAMRNNSSRPLRGTLCGVGAGGITPQLTRGNIDDPLTVWTIESDRSDGRNLSFKFKTIDASGKEATRSLLLSKEPVGQGTLRIGVQLDLTTGRCRAWCSVSTTEILPPRLSGKLDLGEGMQLKAFEYGAFQLGPVTGRLFSDDAMDQQDWTCCGLSLHSAPRYAAEGAADQIGALQQTPAEKPATDMYRFFTSQGDRPPIIFLPLQSRPTDLLVEYELGHDYGGPERGYGFWTPRRRPQPIQGPISLRDIQLFTGSPNCGYAVAVGEATQVTLENVYLGGGGFQGVAGLPLSGLDRSMTLNGCRIIGSDASLFGYDQNIECDNCGGGGGETMFRLVGCRGSVDSALVTGFVACDYYVKLHAGPTGGPLSFTQFCVDNEGLGFAPKKACFYAEPSLDGKTALSFPGTLYSGALYNHPAVIELADPPGGATAKGAMDLDGIDLFVNPKKPPRCIVLARSNHWSGSIRLAQTDWANVLTDGLIDATFDGPCPIVSYHDDRATLPTRGTWRAGSHIFHLFGQVDPATGMPTVKTYQCVGSGAYGTSREPKWEQIK